MTTQQSLVILFKSSVLEAYRNERDIYLRSLHPIVKRLGINDRLDGEFVSIISHSEEFGNERGVLSLTTLEQINILDNHEQIAKEREERKQMSPEQIQEIESNVKKLQEEKRIAEENYSKYLAEQGYISATTGSYEDTEYWSIHPFYYKEWTINEDGEFPSWAVIRRGR